MPINNRVAAMQEEIAAWRREIHADPELLYDVHRTAANVAEKLLTLTPIGDHVFTLHAELEGLKLSGVFEQLIEGWKSAGYELVAMRDLVDSVGAIALPLHAVLDASIPGRSGTLATQGPAFLA